MFRLVENDLLEWKNQPSRKPLLIRGARQVGKSFTVVKFGQAQFKRLININFELDPKFIACFESLDPEKIVRAIELIIQSDIIPGETLLFLDEIQECPQAILALRYFKEKMPQLHVIGAGSFLEFVIHDENYQQPVGRVESLYMKPCSFTEFLIANEQDRLVQHLADASLKTGIEPAVHQLLLEKCREYFILGGMPEAIDYFQTTNKFFGCEKIHASILEYYRRDLAKYASKLNTRVMEKIFTKVPGMVSQQIKYSDIDPNIQARDQKPALEAMQQASIIHTVYSTSASGLPLNIGVNEKKYKLLFLDVGLVMHETKLDSDILLQEDLMLLNRGQIVEQFVGQELLAYGKSYEQQQLFYWHREKPSSQAEIDYVINVGPEIFPIEVKSGKSGRLKSLHLFMQEKKCKIGIQISQQPLGFKNSILSVPLYMIREIPRLLRYHL